MLLYQTFLYLPAQLLGPCFQFIAAIVWTHWLTPEAYGLVTFILVAQELAFLLSISWWSHYTLRFLPQFQSTQRKQEFQHTENVVLAFSGLAQCFVAISSLVLFHAPMRWPLIAATIIYSVTRSLTSYLSERARASASIGVYTAVQFFSLVLGFALAFAGVALVAPAPETVLAGFSLGQIIALVYLRSKIAFNFSFRFPPLGIARAASRYGMPLVISGAIGWVSVNGIRIIVERLQDVEAVGLLSVGWGLGHRAAAVAAMLVTAAAFPLAVKKITEGTTSGALDQLARNGTLLTALLAPVTAGIILLSDPMVDLLIAETFRPVTKMILPIAALAGAIRNLRVHFPDQVLILLERTNLTIIVNGIEAALVVALCIIGYQTDGLRGASLGCLAGISAGTLTCFLIAVFWLGLRFPFSETARIGLATVIMILALAFINWQRLGLLNGMIAEACAGIIVYAAMFALLFPALARRTWAQLRGMRA